MIDIVRELSVSAPPSKRAAGSVPPSAIEKEWKKIFLNAGVHQIDATVQSAMNVDASVRPFDCEATHRKLQDLGL
jgi:hypothetical protein